MKKYLISGILALIVLMPIIGAGEVFTSEISKEFEPSSTNELTHTVLIEYVGQTTCGYCPTASNQLSSIYDAGDLDFYYVSMILDVNPRVYPRVQELGVTGTPDVYFDGGFNSIVGAQTDEQPYRTAITQSGERVVPDIDIDVSAEFKGGGTIKISVTVTNNEAEEYDGHLRVYIVEPEARWEYNVGGDIHYGVLDIPIDKSLALPQGGQYRPLGDTYTFTKTWLGAIFGFNDITEDNIKVIAAVFDGETDHAVQTAAAEPTSSTEQFNFFENFRIFRFLKERGFFLRFFNLIENN
jgi:hypothetical protein